MKRLEKNKFLLLALREAESKLNNAIINNSESDLIRIISEITYNIIKGNHKIDEKTKTILTKNKGPLRKLLLSEKESIGKEKRKNTAWWCYSRTE